MRNAIGAGPQARRRGPPRHHSAERGPGRRHPLRRRGGHGHPGGRGGGRARRALRRDPCAGGGGWSPWPPAGASFDDALAAELAAEPQLTLLCGRYEGFDERVHEHLATDVVSIGPYVLAGGELAAMVVCDAVIRKLPGALGHADSAVEESFSAALEGAPEYPHYTRPADWQWARGAGGPAVGRPRPDPRVAPRSGRRRARATRRSEPVATIRRRAAAAPLPAPRASSLHEQRDRQHRACPASPGPVLPGGRPRARALPGRGGHPPPHPGLRGHRAQAPGQRARARPSPSASSPSASAWSARSPCTRPRSSRSRWPAAATCAGPSSTTCASAWAAAPASASAASPPPSSRRA